MFLEQHKTKRRKKGKYCFSWNVLFCFFFVSASLSSAYAACLFDMPMQHFLSYCTIERAREREEEENINQKLSFNAFAPVYSKTNNTQNIHLLLVLLLKLWYVKFNVFESVFFSVFIFAIIIFSDSNAFYLFEWFFYSFFRASVLSCYFF